VLPVLARSYVSQLQKPHVGASPQRVYPHGLSELGAALPRFTSVSVTPLRGDDGGAHLPSRQSS
jgi:hypothetical protein